MDGTSSDSFSTSLASSPAGGEGQRDEGEGSNGEEHGIEEMKLWQTSSWIMRFLSDGYSRLALSGSCLSSFSVSIGFFFDE